MGQSQSMGGEKMMEQVFNLKFTSKQLSKSAVKAEKDVTTERLKVKKAIEKGNMEGAKIYAENAIRKKNESLNYMKLASRLDAVVSKLDSQVKMNKVTRDIAGLNKSLEQSVACNNLEKITATMAQFEQSTENLDMQAQVTNGVLGAQANLSTPEDEVRNLIQQVADEHNLDVQMSLANAPAGAPAQKESPAQDDMAARVAGLR